MSRRRLLGAVTALVGFEIVTLLTAIRAAATDSASTSVLWLVFGLGFSATVALVGAFCGLAGGTVAHPTSILRSMRRTRMTHPAAPDRNAGPTLGLSDERIVRASEPGAPTGGGAGSRGLGCRGPATLPRGSEQPAGETPSAHRSPGMSWPAAPSGARHALDVVQPLALAFGDQRAVEGVIGQHHDGSW